jgi:hypothetical protein
LTRRASQGKGKAEFTHKKRQDRRQEAQEDGGRSEVLVWHNKEQGGCLVILKPWAWDLRQPISTSALRLIKFEYNK